MITIIILLILAGVTIGMATSGTGLFDKAKEATQKYQNAQDDEQLQLAKYSNDIYNYVSSDRNNTELTTLYEDFTITSNPVITLSESYKNFKTLIFCYGNNSNLMYAVTSVFPVSILSAMQQENSRFTVCYGTTAINYEITNDNTFTHTGNSPSNAKMYMKAIYGVK